jgi:hypothetical protein
MSESSVREQIDLVHTLIASPSKRKQYLADPDGFLRSQGITPSPTLKDALTESLKTLESEFEKLGNANPFATGAAPAGGATTMNVAAAVSAAAAVVSAAAAVTTATSAAKMAK